MQFSLLFCSVLLVLKSIHTLSTPATVYFFTVLTLILLPGYVTSAVTTISVEIIMLLLSLVIILLVFPYFYLFIASESNRILLQKAIYYVNSILLDTVALLEYS